MHSKLVIASIFAVLLALLAPLEAEAIECVGDQTYANAAKLGCPSITGNLRIENLGRTNLDGLSALTSVRGYLLIENNAALTNLDGLSALTVVGGDVRGDFHINDNAALTNLDGLSALTVVGTLEIYDNDTLTNLDGLSALTDVDGGLYIFGNAALTNLDGLSALTVVGEDLAINDNVSLCQQSVDGLLSQMTVGGSILDVSNNNGSCGPAMLFASTLPSSRSVQVGGSATAYATVINAGANTGYGCTLTLGSDIPATFTSWATDPATNAIIGDRNPAVNIPAGGFATWVFRIVPSATILPTDVELLYRCANADPATVLPGINTILLSASDEPTADIIAITLTINRDGILSINGPQDSAAFATATINFGRGGRITVEPRLSMNSIPLSLTICETDPVSGLCTSAIGPSVTTTIEADATPTFAVFATATGTIPLDPANYRIYIEFTDELGAVRGSSSVAVTTAFVT